MSLLLLERLSAILACWALREVSTSSVPRRSEVTDACDRLLWDEWLPLSRRLLKSTLEKVKNVNNGASKSSCSFSSRPQTTNCYCFGGFTSSGAA